MITHFMTFEETHATLKAAHDILVKMAYNYCQLNTNKIKRIYSRTKGNIPLKEPLIYKNNNQVYYGLACFTIERKIYTSCTFYGIWTNVITENGKEIILGYREMPIIDNPKEKYYFSYSPHFFKRYAERIMNEPHIEQQKAIIDYFNSRFKYGEFVSENNNVFHQGNQDKQDKCYAISERGYIAICTRKLNTENHTSVLHYATCISRDMTFKEQEEQILNNKSDELYELIEKTYHSDEAKLLDFKLSMEKSIELGFQ